MTRWRRVLFCLVAGAVALLVLTDASWQPSTASGHQHEDGAFFGIRTALAQVGTFLQLWDGRPATPQPWRPADWDVQIHHFEQAAWTQFEPMLALHGPDCSGPPATHPISTHEQAVFICNDHMMTAIQSGYGVIYLTPNQQVDFASGEAVVRFDLSTLRTSPRDWVDLWISPYEDHLALPLDEDQDLAGPPRRAVHIKQLLGAQSFFEAGVYRNFVRTTLPVINGDGVESVLAPSAAQREPFELRISRTRVRFGMPNRNLWWVDSTIADLGWTRGVVQFGHHVYNADKDCLRFNSATNQYESGPEPCANTWHWDNARIEPAVPFTILRADRRYVDATTSPSVTFPMAAPTGAYLRFGGVGQSIQVSFNGGSTWQTAQLQAQQGVHGANAFRSYWTPVPPGTTQVHFRGQNSVYDWMARDISIFAATSSGGPPPTPTPTPSGPAPTPTPLAASCSPRPPVRISSVAESPGILRATVAATGANNTIRRIDFNTQNAIVRRPGVPDQVGAFSTSMQTPTTEFRVLRQRPGAATTVHMVVTDACGAWNTFVGGGANGF